MLNLFKLFAITLIFFVTPIHAADNSVVLASKVGQFTINPQTLQVIFKPDDADHPINLIKASSNLGKPNDIQSDADTAYWRYPKLNMVVKVQAGDQGLHFLFTTHKTLNFQWPKLGLTPQASALIIPSGEGLYVPNHDPFWLKMFDKYPQPKLSMPFCGVQYGKYFISIRSLDGDTNTTTHIQQTNGMLYLNQLHSFNALTSSANYNLYLDVSEDSPLGPALAYRHFLIEHNKFVSLKQKLLENANIKDLFGAFHVWVWGDGKSLAMLHKFNELGIKHLWIGYDATPVSNSPNIDREYIITAKNMGYLVGPYDSFDNAQNPKTADSITSLWPDDIWPDACIQQKNGKLLTGFANRGCYLSSEALHEREVKEQTLAKQIAALTKQGDNSLFLDCDAADPLYEDYAKQHPMTKSQDLENRLERMHYISSKKKLVLGSETGLSWAIPAIAFNNGGFLAFPEAFWPNLNNKAQFGKWWPPTKPGVLFKPYHAPSDFLTASYSPRYRLPLYEAAFHDAVISTDRWELNELKIPALHQTKALLQNLYDIPPIWVLDLNTLEKNQRYFVAYYKFFSPIHEIAALEPLTKFSWLTKDHLVQQTTFGDLLILTANFSKKSFKNIGPGCLQAQWKEDDSTQIFCPNQFN